MTLFLSYLINGISLGSVYAIIALGYTMVYGIAKMLNFAHGDVIMVGAYVSFCAMQYLGLPKLVSVVLAMAVCTALGIVIEGLAYKPLRKAPSLAVLITAIGVSYFLQNSALLSGAPRRRAIPPSFSLGSLTLMDGQLVISGGTIVTVLANIVIMAALTAFTGRTKFGKAMRAVSEDKGAAELMGINVNMTISMTFAIGSALAAIAGVLLCSAYPTLQPTTGSMPGIKAFTAAGLLAVDDSDTAFQKAVEEAARKMVEEQAKAEAETAEDKVEKTAADKVAEDTAAKAKAEAAAARARARAKAKAEAANKTENISTESE